jgi:N-acetylneuraminic acid mutarotase
MPTARSGIAGAGLAGRVYIVGGESNFGTFEENEAYDPTSDTWGSADPIPTARHGTAAVVVNGAMYVPAGGPKSRLSVSEVNEAFRP